MGNCVTLGLACTLAGVSIASMLSLTRVFTSLQSGEGFPVAVYGELDPRGRLADLGEDVVASGQHR